MLIWEHTICLLMILKIKSHRDYSICCVLSTEQRGFRTFFFFNPHNNLAVPILKRLKQLNSFGHTHHSTWKGMKLLSVWHWSQCNDEKGHGIWCHILQADTPPPTWQQCTWVRNLNTLGLVFLRCKMGIMLSTKMGRTKGD